MRLSKERGLAGPVFACLRLMGDFEGRIGRRLFWCGALALAAGLFALAHATTGLPRDAHLFVMGSAYAASLYPAAALVRKRLRDRDRGAALAWIFLGVPFLVAVATLALRPDPASGVALAMSAIWFPVALWALIELGLMPGAAAARQD